MLDQSRGITQAAEILSGTLGTPQERLVKGFKAFQRATILSDDWPVHLWDKYDRICEILLAGGTLQKTVDRMDLKAASESATQVAKDMKDLAVAVEIARTRRVSPTPAITPLPGQTDSPSVLAECAGICRTTG